MVAWANGANDNSTKRHVSEKGMTLTTVGIIRCCTLWYLRNFSKRYKQLYFSSSCWYGFHTVQLSKDQKLFQDLLMWKEDQLLWEGDKRSTICHPQDRHVYWFFRTIVGWLLSITDDSASTCWFGNTLLVAPQVILVQRVQPWLGHCHMCKLKPTHVHVPRALDLWLLGNNLGSQLRYNIRNMEKYTPSRPSLVPLEPPVSVAVATSPSLKR